MRKITDRDINFVLNATILALIVMAVLQAVHPLLSPPDQRLPEVQEYTGKLVAIRPVDLEKQLHSKEAKPSMLVVYATWCAYCRMLVPEVVSLMQEKKLDGVQAFFLALDEKPFDVSNYLVHNEYKDVFTPYIIAPGTSHELAGVLSITGSNFKGQIPYIGFFDGNARLVEETTGMLGQERILEIVRQKLLARNPS